MKGGKWGSGIRTINNQKRRRREKIRKERTMTEFHEGARGGVGSPPRKPKLHCQNLGGGENHHGAFEFVKN